MKGLNVRKHVVISVDAEKDRQTPTSLHSKRPKESKVTVSIS